MIPYGQIDTIFLDVGNTLISIDFDWVARELAARQQACSADALRRAEAMARPAYSQRLFVDGIPAGTDLFRAYLQAILTSLAQTAALPAEERDALLTDLRAALRPPGVGASALWKSVMPRVPEALARLHAIGMRLVVVSNSDGTVERSLEDAGLRSYFAGVVDSAIAGYEKPDPRIFAHAIERWHADPARTLHVGDLYHADVQGARSAGLHAVLLDPYGDWSLSDCESEPDVWAVADRIEAARG
jgi:HAD superfamily hydrolase (TIGR01662 family)